MYSSESRDVFGALEALRGVAALYVAIAHARFILFVGGTQYLAEHPIKEQGFIEFSSFIFSMFFSYGISGVVLFFIISGYCIEYSLKSSRYREMCFSNALKDFYFRRAIRIYIPYIVAIIFSMLVVTAIVVINSRVVSGLYDAEIYQKLEVAHSSATNIAFIIDTVFYNLYGLFTGNTLITSGVYIGGNQPLWSLNLEVLFYMISPIFLTKIRSIYLIAIIVFGVFIGLFNYSHEYMNDYFSMFLRWLPFFVIGVLFQRKLNSIVRYLNYKKTSPYLFLVLFVVFFSVSFVLDKLDYSYGSYLLVSVGFIFLIIFMFSKCALSYWIRNAFKGMGNISYTLYMVHFPVLLLFLSIYTKYTGIYTIENMYLFIVGSVVAVLMAKILFHFGEKQTQSFLSKTR